MNHTQIKNIYKLMNTIDLLGISFILIAAFICQFLLHELPCPLCLLQRLGLVAIGFGFLLNIHYQIRPAHYGLSLLAAVFTGFVAIRQISLHILPVDPGYGDIFLNLHLYTWVFIISVVTIIYTAIMVSFSAQYMSYHPTDKINEALNKWIKRLGHFAFSLVIILLIGNIISTFLECGFEICPDNPVAYRLRLK